MDGPSPPRPQANIGKVQTSRDRESVDTPGQYKEGWKKCQNQNNFARDLDDYASRLFREMANALQIATKIGPEAKVQAIADVTEFLRDEKGTNKIDSCIRWLILFNAAEYAPHKESLSSDWEGQTQVNEINTDALIVEIIAEIEEYLSFENPHQQILQPGSGGNGTGFKAQCIEREKHWQHTKKKTTPFHRAAANGKARVVRNMIHFLEWYCKQQVVVDPASRRALFSSLRGGAYEGAHELLLHVLRQQDPNPGGRSTALQQAASEEPVSMETLDALLKYPGVAGPPDTTFQNALDDGAEAVVEKFLEYEELRTLFVTSENIIKAMKLRHEALNNRIDRKDGWTGILLSLLEHARSIEVFNGEVVQKIIELGFMDIWEKRPLDVELDTRGLLHLAVYYQNIGFVKLFAQKYPHSVSHKALVRGTEKLVGDKRQGYYPLWYNNKIWEDSKWCNRPAGKPASHEIRSELVTATIRGTDHMQALTEIFEQSAEKSTELCFDMSRFNSRLYRVYDFVRSLINHRENEGLLSYESTIRYARLPALGLSPDDKDSFGTPIREEHTEVFDVLDWLRIAKGVSSIIELQVFDRLVNPHNEERIAEYVESFGVEILDWRFLDMSLSVFDAKAKPRIRGLHLYSSGKRAAISHWLSDDGLKSLNNLEWVRIHVIQEMMTRPHCQTTCKYIKRGLNELRTNWHRKKSEHEEDDHKGIRVPVATVHPQLWNPTRLESLPDLEETTQRAFPTLFRFIMSYRTYAGGIQQESRRIRRTRVAILDNGILSMLPVSADTPVSIRPQKHGAKSPLGMTSAQNISIGAYANIADPDSYYDSSADPAYPLTDSQTLWSQIKEGRSFVDDAFQVSPWLFASDPHGTQLANLICAIDPLCELYVAKVADGKYGITPQRVSRAIEWAREKEVDIISMSFVILETTEALDASISGANADGIVMMCSTHDQGSNISRAWPAEASETFAIAACDEYGRMPRDLEDSKYAFKLQGLNIPAGDIPFLESSGSISGSSVATAIASGLSSLILSCAHLNNPTEAYQGVMKRALVKKYLENMQSSSGSKYLLLEKFGNIDAKVKEGEPINAEAILKQAFAAHIVNAAI